MILKLRTPFSGRDALRRFCAYNPATRRNEKHAIREAGKHQLQPQEPNIDKAEDDASDER